MKINPGAALQGLDVHDVYMNASSTAVMKEWTAKR